jgi:hypothetical protein
VKGIIFNLVEDAVGERFGEPVWDRLLLDAGLEGGYTSMGSYPDAELHALVDAASAALATPPEQVLTLLGHDAALGLARAHPQFFAPHSHTRGLVLTLNDVIHPEVRKVQPDARPPEFGFADEGDDLLVEYRSSRGLCALAEGMIGGAAQWYDEVARVGHDTCTHRGDAVCVLRCRFVPAGGAPDEV